MGTYSSLRLSSSFCSGRVSNVLVAPGSVDASVTPLASSSPAGETFTYFRVNGGCVLSVGIQANHSDRVGLIARIPPNTDPDSHCVKARRLQKSAFCTRRTTMPVNEARSKSSPSKSDCVSLADRSPRATLARIVGGIQQRTRLRYRFESRYLLPSMAG